MKVAQTKEWIKLVAPVYLVMGESAFLCDEALSQLIKVVTKGDSALLKTFDGERLDPSLFFQDLDSLSFFSRDQVFLLRHVEALSKEILKRLEAYVESPQKNVTLILAATTLNRGSKLYKILEKNGAVLDFPEEKPWEALRKAEDWLGFKFAEINIAIDPEARRCLLQHIGSDLASLNHEVEKLTLYIGARKKVTLADVQAVSAPRATETIWQLGDALFKRDSATALHILAGLTHEGLALMTLIRQIRTQFHTKYQVCSILNSQGTPQDVAAHFPYMKGKILDQNCQMARSYGMERFATAMLAIDETEADVKSQSVDDSLLAERLIAKLTL